MCADYAYEAEKRETIAEAPGLRIRRLRLAAGQSVPWHHHSNITDTFFCMTGRVVVEMRDPKAQRVLDPGQMFAVPPGVVHFVHGEGFGACAFMVVQGIGVYDFVPDGDGS
jgi:quercetin dioxygenase-like cupin family protein